MSQAHLVSHEIVSSTVSNIIEYFKYLKAAYRKRRDIAITMKQLSNLNDRELNDMGISRGDIYAIAHGDPSHKRSNTQPNPNLKGWV